MTKVRLKDLIDYNLRYLKEKDDVPSNSVLTENEFIPYATWCLDRSIKMDGVKPKNYEQGLKDYWKKYKKLPEYFEVEEEYQIDFREIIEYAMILVIKQRNNIVTDKFYWDWHEDLDAVYSKEAIQDEKNFVKQRKKFGFKNFNVLTSKQRKEKFYDPYRKLLEAKSPYKKHMDRLIQKNLPDLNHVVKQHLQDVQIYNRHYKDRINKVLKNFYGRIKIHGFIPHLYKRMDAGPRFIPMNEGQTINNVKMIYRHKVYALMPKLNSHYTILNFDLVSFYNSILVGFSPKELTNIKNAIETTGLLRKIKNEFKEAGKERFFNKPAIKTCLCNLVFLNDLPSIGNSTIQNAQETLECEQKELFEQIEDQAQKIMFFMLQRLLMRDYDSLSSAILRVFDDKYLISPTGHRHLILGHDLFFKAYPNFFHSFEFYILSKASLDLKQEFPEVEFIGNLHDENALAVPTQQVEAVKQYYINRVEEIGFELNLHYPVKLELQAEYSPEAKLVS